MNTSTILHSTASSLPMRTRPLRPHPREPPVPALHRIVPTDANCESDQGHSRCTRSCTPPHRPYRCEPIAPLRRGMPSMDLHSTASSLPMRTGQIATARHRSARPALHRIVPTDANRPSGRNSVALVPRSCTPPHRPYRCEPRDLIVNPDRALPLHSTASSLPMRTLRPRKSWVFRLVPALHRIVPTDANLSPGRARAEVCPTLHSTASSLPMRTHRAAGAGARHSDPALHRIVPTDANHSCSIASSTRHTTCTPPHRPYRCELQSFGGGAVGTSPALHRIVPTDANRSRRCRPRFAKRSPCTPSHRPYRCELLLTLIP